MRIMNNSCFNIFTSSEHIFVNFLFLECAEFILLKSAGANSYFHYQ